MSGLDSRRNDVTFTSTQGIQMNDEFMPEPELDTRTIDERVNVLFKLYGLLARSVGQLRADFESYVKQSDRQHAEYDSYLDVRIAEVEQDIELFVNRFGGSRVAD